MKAIRHLAALLYTACIAVLLFYAMHGIDHVHFGG